MSRVRRRDSWRAVLLVPHPPLSVVYLLALRAAWLEPSFLPPLVLGLLPAAALMLSLAALPRSADRRRDVLLLTLALVEVGWAALALSIVGFAVAWRMG